MLLISNKSLISRSYSNEFYFELGNCIRAVVFLTNFDMNYLPRNISSMWNTSDKFHWKHWNRTYTANSRKSHFFTCFSNHWLLEIEKQITKALFISRKWNKNNKITVSEHDSNAHATKHGVRKPFSVRITQRNKNY